MRQSYRTVKESRQLTDESPVIKKENEKKSYERIDYIGVSKLGGGLKMSLSSFKYRKVLLLFMHTAVMELHNQLLSQAKRCQRSL